MHYICRTASPLPVVRARVSIMQQTAYQSGSFELAEQTIEIMKKLSGPAVEVWMPLPPDQSQYLGCKRTRH